ncbi:hypothetical protein MAA5396_04319 [Marinovum algicola]|uniref:Uncharacterized protein n=1 Tax=Marinovum algicola TaxID=42444 RepID=A0A975ZQA6_9RHOB|nr:hypothetical protein [Marinovum algicola]SEK03824.1 hypothetical protein SAMN04487940_12032 [Marinovum algicola]SLN74669.1 hypothetical protein MAA5396_04319 [Marinovum algicola]
MPNASNYVELSRQFVEISLLDVAQADIEAQIAWGHLSLPTWPDIIKQHRVVLLSSAGTGKTWEIAQQCRKLRGEGKPAFFIRLEYLASGFSDIVFEGDGDLASFNDAVSKDEEIWIFLDSIDEARLDGPAAFDKALRTLSPHIRNNLQRTHIILTSRVGAWRPTDDAARVDSLFPYNKPKEADQSNSTDDTDVDDFLDDPEPDAVDAEHKSPITYYTLRHLTPDQMRLYADAKGTPDAETLISEIVRRDFQNLAGRPKDLDDIIAFWRKERRLGNRREIVEANIERKLKEHDLNRSTRVDLTPDKALTGAMKLAATVALTHQAKIIVPDQTDHDDGFAVSDVHADWMPTECSALLELPIFEPETYGFVRFDHRDSREFLAAQWFYELIKLGQSRHVEGLFFKTQYGVEIVIPSLRPILPWLALFDTAIRTRLLRDWPEILLEGGDPASLQAEDRTKLLERFCAKCAATPEPSLSFDLATLQRLISPELSDVFRSIHERYGSHGEVERFVLRSIEIGLLADLADVALAAAGKTGQSRYTRFAAMRAISAVGTDAQIKSAVEAIAKDPALGERRELADFIETFGARYLSCDLVMGLVEKAGGGERYSADGINRAMQGYVRACSVEDTFAIVSRTARNLKAEPYIERRYFEVSKDNAWMLNFGIPACERLVEERNPLALQEPALSIIASVTLAQDYDIRDSKSRLGELVPAWRELNAALFWHDIETVRSFNQRGDGERVTDWWRARFYRDQWRFTAEDIEEAIAWISDKEFQDDKMVALTLAFSLYLEAGRPPAIRRRLWATVKGNAELSELLKRLLNPPPESDEEKRYKRSEASWKRRQRAREEANAAARAGWREHLPMHLDHVREVEPPPEGNFWNSQGYLFDRMREHRGSNSKWSQTNWRSLAEEFGQETAEAMRDGLMAMWRRFNPVLASEKGEKGNSYPRLQIMGLSGLEIEAREIESWPADLSDDEARRAARYLFCELNGFPSWFKLFADQYPEITLDVVGREAEWELFDVTADDPPHYVMNDLAWDAPWYGERLAPHLLEHLRTRNPVFVQPLGIALGAILRCEDIPDGDVASLCLGKIDASTTPDTHIHLWYAAWVSVDPAPAIERLSEALAALEREEATELAIGFINALNGSRRDQGIGVRKNHVAAQHLSDLHKLMHEHIRPDEDIERAGGGVYSPNSRDDAQDARGHIYEALRDIPGKETFDALMEIAQAAPTEQARAWRTGQAIMRAKADADTPWSVNRVNEFASQLECTPTNPRELFDIAVSRLLDLKYEYEDGDFSPAEVIIETNEETKLRNYLAGELQRRSQGRYSISQEDEMPNKQRTDIRFMRAGIQGMVPVELKIADNKWSGPRLFEKLRDQLCGDYLRDEGNKNGVFLLVSRGKQQHWQTPTGERLDYEELVKALQKYGLELLSTDSDFKPAAIENIQVVGIDLTKRREVRQN